MKYSKIIKNNRENKNSYLMSCIFGIIFLFIICILGINNDIKGTNASFGGMTGVITVPYKITYNFNFSDDSLGNEPVEINATKEHVILDNMFTVPSGYKFDGWNTMSDGTGINYMANDVLPLSSNVLLYAKWILVTDEDLDDDTSNDDNTASGEETDSGNGNNTDGSTSGTGSTDSSSGNTQGNNSSNTGSGTGSGNGSGNSTNNNGGNNSGTTGTSENKDNGNKENSNTEENNSKEDTSNILEKVYYDFKFVNGDKDYFATACEALSDGTCELLLPGINPVRSGYIFTGWSLDKNCPTNNIITNSISVNSSNTYYACFIENDDSDNGVNFITVVITVFAIWIIAFSVIYYLVNKFRKKEIED